MENPGAGINFRKLSEDCKLKPLNDILSSQDEDELTLLMGIVKIIDVSVSSSSTPKKVSLKNKYSVLRCGVPALPTIIDGRMCLLGQSSLYGMLRE